MLQRSNHLAVLAKLGGDVESLEQTLSLREPQLRRMRPERRNFDAAAGMGCAGVVPLYCGGGVVWLRHFH
jgi:hypothetical protein